MLIHKVNKWRDSNSDGRIVDDCELWVDPRQVFKPQTQLVSEKGRSDKSNFLAEIFFFVLENLLNIGTHLRSGAALMKWRSSLLGQILLVIRKNARIWTYYGSVRLEVEVAGCYACFTHSKKFTSAEVKRTCSTQSSPGEKQLTKWTTLQQKRVYDKVARGVRLFVTSLENCFASAGKCFSVT